MWAIADTTATHPLRVPLDAVDLGAWLFSLSDQEYRACSPAHVAAGATRAEDGSRMSINVEYIAGTLLVQRYVEQLATPDHVRVRSLSYVYTAAGETTLDVTWELRATAIDAGACTLENRVIVQATPAFLDGLRQSGVADVAGVTARMASSATDHNREETPQFARDIEAEAKRGAWRRSPAL